MSINIDELIQDSKVQSDDQANTNVNLPKNLDQKNEDKENLELALSETKDKLNVKMSQIKRRDLELDTLQRARDLNIGYVNLENVTIEPDTLRLISEFEAKNKQTICFYYVPFQELRIASSNPEASQIQTLKERLGQEHHTPVKLYLVSQDSLDEALALYSNLPRLHQAMNKVELSSEEINKFSNIENLSSLAEALMSVNTSELLSLIISAALKFKASDIHLEVAEMSVNIRYRIDGILQDVSELDKSYYKTLVSRIKLLSKLKINIINKPQDGHFVITQPSGKIDVRVSTLPTNYGESIVMRVLRSDILQLELPNLGLNKYALETLRKETKKPNGLLVVTGPTGSGKTTTLYSILAELNSKEIKILTIEDPIEYEMPGINQSQVNPDAGYSFASGLRSLVRQDPDVILVGEMRDEETVEIGISAALTGHLVLSTLHTNDAAGSLPRFLSMGAKPYLLAPALNAIVAQRLVRVLCTACKEEAPLESRLQEKVNQIIETMPEKVKKELSIDKKYYIAKGCKECFGFGYKGRVGIFEIFTMTARLRNVVLTGEISAVTLKKLLAEEGMLTMAQDGILKALKGITSIEEIFRVVQEK